MKVYIEKRHECDVTSIRALVKVNRKNGGKINLRIITMLLITVLLVTITFDRKYKIFSFFLDERRRNTRGVVGCIGSVQKCC